MDAPAGKAIRINCLTPDRSTSTGMDCPTRIGPDPNSRLPSPNTANDTDAFVSPLVPRMSSSSPTDAVKRCAEPFKSTRKANAACVPSPCGTGWPAMDNGWPSTLLSMEGLPKSWVAFDRSKAEIETMSADAIDALANARMNEQRRQSVIARALVIV